MTKPFNPNALQFYLTIPAPCPYVSGRMERKIFTQLDPLTGPFLNNYLTHAGFRRSQNVIYRPACESCKECRSLRICTDEFSPSRNFKRIVSKNKDLTREPCEALATQEQFELLRLYLKSRHDGGGMSDMDFARYEMMVEECAAETRLTEYRNADGKLIACALIDKLDDGISMVYSFFDPSENKRSLGNLMILDHIQVCREDDKPYLYLGYWVSSSQKMNYKARFQPCEILGKTGWQKMTHSDM